VTARRTCTDPFTGDDIIDTELTRELARLRRERRVASQSQRAARKQHWNDSSGGASKPPRKKA